MREKTNIYFLSEINRGYGTGDCILLENIDSNGNISHALIDTYTKNKWRSCMRFFKKT